MSNDRGYFKHNSATKVAKPNKRRDVVMPCPIEGCDDEEFSWFCKDCKGILEYGFDDRRLYCECGTFEKFTLKFNCGSHEFKYGKASKIEAELKKIKPYQEVNLLILGETGVGKSTFINAFANYIAYSSLDEAQTGDLITLIPNQFYLTNDNSEEVCIQNGDVTKEENFGPGQSATQATKIHRFVLDETAIRLIDTPGVGDVRGALKDDENFKNILDTIGSLDAIHGIIILLKPNQARLTITFRYCIEELLVHLHKSAVENMVFGFTNTRGTNFRPGDTMPPLKELLAKKAVGLEVKRENTFCFDSEGYRFLASLRPEYDMKYDDFLRDSFDSSWKFSVKETERMIDYIKGLTPHNTKQTMCLNNARILILQLTKPMAEITKAIMKNVDFLESHKNVVKNLDEHNADLRKGLMVEKINLVAKELGYPRTVCTNSECVDVTDIDGVKNIHYKTACHEHCYLGSVTIETTNNPALIHCWAMNGTENCRGPNCGHKYTEHMHITYEMIETKVKVENKAIQQLIAQNVSSGQLKAAQITELEREIKEYKDEHLAIEKIAAKFGAFLKHNAITIERDARLDYLQFLISEEEKKPKDFKDVKLLQALTEARLIYQEQVTLIEKAIKAGDAELGEIKDPATIEKLIDDLFKLKHFGESLKEIKKVAIQHSNKLHNEKSYHQWIGSKISSGLTGVIGQSVNAVKSFLGGRKNETKKNSSKATPNNAKAGTYHLKNNINVSFEEKNEKATSSNKKGQGDKKVTQNSEESDLSPAKKVELLSRKFNEATIKSENGAIPKIRCTTCTEYGHIWQNCPVNNASTHSAHESEMEPFTNFGRRYNIRCLVCGGIGHSQIECPNFVRPQAAWTYDGRSGRSWQSVERNFHENVQQTREPLQKSPREEARINLARETQKREPAPNFSRGNNNFCFGCGSHGHSEKECSLSERAAPNYSTMSGHDPNFSRNKLGTTHPEPFTGDEFVKQTQPPAGQTSFNRIDDWLEEEKSPCRRCRTFEHSENECPNYSGAKPRGRTSAARHSPSSFENSQETTPSATEHYRTLSGQGPNMNYPAKTVDPVGLENLAGKNLKKSIYSSVETLKNDFLQNPRFGRPNRIRNDQGWDMMDDDIGSMPKDDLIKLVAQLRLKKEQGHEMTRPPGPASTVQTSFSAQPTAREVDANRLPRTNSPNYVFEEPEETSVERCYSCFEYGHVNDNCPRRAARQFRK